MGVTRNVATGVEAMGTSDVGSSSTRLTANGTTVIKTGAGILRSVTITASGGSSNSLTLYDNTAGSGTVIADFNTTTSGLLGQSMRLDIRFTTGLTAVLATGSSATVVIVWD
jgi:hypothetical protein